MKKFLAIITLIILISNIFISSQQIASDNEIDAGSIHNTNPKDGTY